ncbi:MAG: rRNA maturation RNase YbeY [Aestuariivirga sp.]|uniref:rRNA maturation RNase YbeY n=1 Tax=Aestuariivirga sp. TaxID=2650926 RepID=UPI0025B8AD52|nr:rRNA maturation RNase YbeY [Aestuariivirga sp.]MCA3562167.1 rRNA maturation RNase YbeY [Aestuariivirga sp.]
MTVSIEVEDDAWAAMAGLVKLAHSAVEAALAEVGRDGSNCNVAVLFADDAAIAEINAEWRGKDKPTNVLSFPIPGGMPVPEGEPRSLGDIVLAHGVIAREAAAQGKTLRDHTAHLIVHGTLHLLGYHHDGNAEAEEMEALESRILKGLGISDPYERD